MKPTKSQAFALQELLQHQNTIIMGRTRGGKRYARWKNWRGNTRAGKIHVLTAWLFKKKDYIEPSDIGVNQWRISDLGMDAALEAEHLIEIGHYDKERKVKVTSNDVLKGLESYYADSGLIVVPEVSIAYGGERRVDALVVGRGNETAIICEVKVSRQDFKHELEQPGKRELALELSSQYFFCAPEGLIKPKELPEECGLLELGKDNKIYPTVEAPHRRPGMPDWRLVGAVVRALKR